MNGFYSSFEKIFVENGLSQYVAPDTAKQFELLFELLKDANEKFNLTSISSEEDVIFKHFADCATVLGYIPENSKVLDVGTGGGFPSFPIAILRPDTDVLAIDSTEKKIRYVNETADSLTLDNLEALTARAEDLAKNKKYFQKFDIVISRAVGNLRILSELCIPFVKLGGSFIAMKGPSAHNELEEAKNAYKTLGCELVSDNGITLKNNGDSLDRHILIFKKTKPTPPAYPRAFSQMTKKPL